MNGETYNSKTVCSDVPEVPVDDPGLGEQPKRKRPQWVGKLAILGVAFLFLSVGTGLGVGVLVWAIRQNHEPIDRWAVYWDAEVALTRAGAVADYLARSYPCESLQPEDYWYSARPWQEIPAGARLEVYAVTEGPKVWMVAYCGTPEVLMGTIELFGSVLDEDFDRSLYARRLYAQQLNEELEPKYLTSVAEKHGIRLETVRELLKRGIVEKWPRPSMVDPETLAQGLQDALLYPPRSQHVNGYSIKDGRAFAVYESPTPPIDCEKEGADPVVLLEEMHNMPLNDTICGEFVQILLDDQVLVKVVVPNVIPHAYFETPFYDASSEEMILFCDLVLRCYCRSSDGCNQLILYDDATGVKVGTYTGLGFIWDPDYERE